MKANQPSRPSSCKHYRFSLALCLLILFHVVSAQTLISSSSELIELLPQGGDYQLAPGHYELSETLVLSKSFSLMGAGTEESIVSTPKALVLISIEGAEHVKLENISFEYLGESGGGVMDIKDSRFVIENCRFAGGVYLDNTALDDLYYGAGLSLHGEAAGEVKNSIFENNSFDGIHLEGNAKLELFDSQIQANDGGLALFDNSSAKVTGSSFSANGSLDGSAVYAGAQARLELTNNSLSNNSGGAIWISENAQLELIDNTLDSNGDTWTAVIIDGQVKLKAKGNRFLNQPAGAIWIYGNAEAEIAENHFEANGNEDTAALTLEGDSLSSLNANTFSNNLGVALFATQQASLNLENSSFEGNQDWTAAYLSDSSNATLKNNQFINNLGGGLFLSGTATASIINNLFEGNTTGGVAADEAAQPRLTLNTLSKNEGHGAYFSGEVVAYLAGNDFEQNGRSGLVIDGQAFATIFENRFTANAVTGLGFLAESGGLVRFNQVVDNGRNGIAVLNTARPKLEQNLVGNNLNGILYANQATGSASQNTISGSDYGIFLGDDAEPRLENNDFDNNQQDMGSGSTD